MVPIFLPADTPVWLQIVVAAIVVVSLYYAIRAWRRNGRF
jgi:membrane protein implicated in regulation of membrane protease activity